MLLVASTLAALILVGAARAHERHTRDSGSPKGFAAGIEAMVHNNTTFSPQLAVTAAWNERFMRAAGCFPECAW